MLLTIATAMHRTTALLTAWPWLVVTAFGHLRVDGVVAEVPDDLIDELAAVVQEIREAYRLYADAMTGREALRLGLTLAARAAAESREQYRIAFFTHGLRKQALEKAKHDHQAILDTIRDLTATARSAEHHVREAQAAYRNTLVELRTVRSAGRDAKAARWRELRDSRARVRHARALAAMGEGTLSGTLRAWCTGDHADAVLDQIAKRLNVPGRYLRALVGEGGGVKGPHLTNDETREILARAHAGTSTTVLAAEYHVSTRRIRQLSRAAGGT